jgi:hypothetical protein
MLCQAEVRRKDNYKHSEKLHLAAEQVQCQPWISRAIMQQLELTAPCVANVRRAICAQNDHQQYKPPAALVHKGSIASGEAVEVAQPVVLIMRAVQCGMLEDVQWQQRLANFAPHRRTTRGGQLEKQQTSQQQV